MKRTTRTGGRLVGAALTVAFATALPDVAAGAAPRGPAVPASVAVAFKLDPRLTRGLYMGDRWVSPATYTAANDGRAPTVAARAVCADERGRPLAVAPSWTASDPEVVQASARHAHQVELAVRRPGRTIVTVGCGPAARPLAVSAVRKKGVWQVDIRQ